MWKCKRLLALTYIEEESTAKTTKLPKYADKEAQERLLVNNDWIQGYVNQIWRCRHHAFCT